MPSPSPSRTKAAALYRSLGACRLCADLPLGPKPIYQLDPRARILIAGQAPGRLAHEAGFPFADISGDRLRDWLGVGRKEFYDPTRFAILPMGFCFPGSGKGGDAPPRPICAAHWRTQLLATLPNIGLTVALGRHAVNWHLPAAGPALRLAEVVAGWRSHLPALMPLPHPSPRNQIWLRRHPWFEQELVPALRQRVGELQRAGFARGPGR
ncbi:uracil-DNA glycosylase [Dongia mobilis]|uniref:Uracil-DNA glycosylase n=1 Tax=Dongia mobilis TaxID=578943 RepID=A0A4R6WS75_9PROT|nr:uracil-DNA glycosylase family protein [Dongia mobilis]TDQ84455.1 uracil-DNA glycosylase [Dongia mobilis]